MSSLVLPIQKANSADVPFHPFEEIHGVQVPKEYIDPIINVIMNDPVVVGPSGVSYDRKTIEKIQKDQLIARDPSTNGPIQSVVSNRSLYQSITRFLDQNPELKEILEKEKAAELLQEKCYTYTADAFMRLFTEKDSFIVPVCHKFCVAADKVLSWRYNNSTPQRKEKLIFEILNQAILPLGKSFKTLRTEGSLSIYVVFSERKEENVLELQSSAPIEFIAHQGTLFTTIFQLFQRMISSQIFVLTVEANQTLVLTEISVLDKECILKSSQGLVGYLVAYLPEEITNIKLEATTLVKIVDIEHAIGLRSPDSGIRLELVKKEDLV